MIRPIKREGVVHWTTPSLFIGRSLTRGILGAPLSLNTRVMRTGEGHVLLSHIDVAR